MQRGRLEEILRKLAWSVTKLPSSGYSNIHSNDSSAFVPKSMPKQVSEYFNSLIPPLNELETIMVTGIICQLIMEAKELPNGKIERLNFVRKKARFRLANCMAGHISISEFFRLLNIIDENIQETLKNLEYFFIIPNNFSQAKSCSYRFMPDNIRLNELRKVLSNLPFSQKDRCKITSQRLLDFLLETGGSWFRLIDFEAHFKVTKKTAWKYLNSLLIEGILQHNSYKANRARYSLASRFYVTRRKNKNFS